MKTDKEKFDDGDYIGEALLIGSLFFAAIVVGIIYLIYRIVV